jgi:hypothetical protein
MSDDDGVLLLLRGRREQAIQQHKVGWSKVVRSLGGFALALDQARAYLRHKSVSVGASKDFLATYYAHRDAVLQKMPRDFWDSTRTRAQAVEERNMMISAFTTWEMLFPEVAGDEQRKPHLHHFMTLSAFFEPAHIEESIFKCCHDSGLQAGWMNIFTTSHPALGRKAGQQPKNHGKWAHVKFWALIRHLQDELSLLRVASSRGPQGSSFSFHPLIRDWIQVRDPPERIQAYATEAMGFVDACIVACMKAPTPAEQQRLVLAHLDAACRNDIKFSCEEYRLGRHISNLHLASSFAAFYKLAGRWSTGCAGITCAGAAPFQIGISKSTKKLLLPQRGPNSTSSKLLDTLTTPGHLSDTPTYLCNCN